MHMDKERDWFQIHKFIAYRMTPILCIGTLDLSPVEKAGWIWVLDIYGCGKVSVAVARMVVSHTARLVIRMISDAEYSVKGDHNIWIQD